jgi:hypothetical protein
MNNTYDTLDIVELGNAEEVVLGNLSVGISDSPATGFRSTPVVDETDE